MSKIEGIKVIDNFYGNPDQVRDHALSQLPFPYISAIPGERSEGVNSTFSEELRVAFEGIIGKSITQWDTFSGENWYADRPTSMNTCFQMILETENSWIHHDDTEYAGLIYLTPNPDAKAGTGLFKHKETGISEYIPSDPLTNLNLHDDRWDLSKWELTDKIDNVYNRLIMYNGMRYHRSIIPGFGKNYIDGRLTQVFFFNTEGVKHGA